MSDTESDPAELRAQVARLTVEVEKLRGFMRGVHSLSESLAEARHDAELHELLSDVLETACTTIRANDASLLVLDEDSNELVFVLTRGSVPAESLAWRRISVHEGVAGWVVKNRRSTVVNNPQADERFYSQLDVELQFKTESILAAPIIGDNRVLGVLEILNKTDGELFNTYDEMMLGLLCRLSGELLYALTRRSLPAANEPPSNTTAG